VPTDKTETQRPTASSEATAVESKAELSPEELAKVAGGMIFQMHEVFVASVVGDDAIEKPLILQHEKVTGRR
jgi:hypothetical protein